MSSWVKMLRSTLKHPIISKDADHLAIWTYIILSASHFTCSGLFGGKCINIAPGQLITDRATIARELKISESKTQRVLKCFESERLISQQTSYKSRLISILYGDYEIADSEEVNANRTPSEREVNANRTPSERIYKNKELKNIEDNNIHTHTLVETKGGLGDFSSDEDPIDGVEVVEWLGKYLPAVQELAEPLTPREAHMLRKRYLEKDIKRLFRDMSNSGSLSSKVSAYKTFLSYADRDFIISTRNEIKKLYTYDEVMSSLKGGERMVDLYEQAEMVGGKIMWRKKSQHYGSA